MRALAFLLLFTSAAFAQALQPTQPPMIIEPADADAFRDIIAKTIPPFYSQDIIKWYNSLVRRQQSKSAAEAKARENDGSSKHE